MTSSSAYLDPNAPLEAARCFLRRLASPQRLLVAISGGSDSTGLLLAFHQVLRERDFHGFSLCAVTVDHALRIESAAEAQRVSALCASLGVAHRTKLWAGEKPKSGLSDASRQARYRLLCEAAVELSANLILLGHTAGDQRETIAMRKERSADDDAMGLAGMAEATLINRQIWALRPFLSIERDDIRSYLSANSCKWIDDPSNDSRKYERVRMREQLKQELPLQDERAAPRRFELSHQAADFVEKAVRLHPNMLISVDRAQCRGAYQAARYALSYVSAIVGGQTYPLARQPLDKVMALITGEGAGRLSAHRCVFDVRKTAVYIYREHRNLPDLDCVISQPMLWDNRVRLFPTDECAAMGQGDVPQSLLQAAAATLPGRGAAADDSSSAYRIEALLRPFEQFLPLFDYALAQAFAHQLAALPFPAPPLSAFHPQSV